MNSITIISLLLGCLIVYPDDFFHSSIPVLDMQEFEDPTTRSKFVNELSSALHDIGFFAVVNSNINDNTILEAYEASKEFFQSPNDKKIEIYDPILNGQRGFVPGETAQGFTQKDLKEFMHIGSNGNLWPLWMNLKDPMELIFNELKIERSKIEVAISLAMNQTEDFLSKKTINSSTLMRVLYYPQNIVENQYWAAPHTDIDLFTILPMSTEEGLQVYKDGNWIDVKVPPHAYIINGGDILENLSNGYFKSSLHQVISKNTKERYSIVYFIHGYDNADFSPLPYFIEKTGGSPKFPEATEIDLLSHRLVELGLASSSLIEYDKNSGFMIKIENLVNSGTSSDAVKKTYQTWQQMKSAANQCNDNPIRSID